MNIDRIEVKELFGLFNHQIPLNKEAGITIIYGPNGFGKTFTLTLVNALFNSSYSDLYRIPFREMAVHFTDRSVLTLKKSKSGSATVFSFELKKPRLKALVFETEAVKYEHGSETRAESDVHLRNNGEPSWLQGIKKSVLVRFIHTERLVRSSDIQKHRIVVVDYSNELKEKIRMKLAEYAELSQKLDSTFPLRLVQAWQVPAVSLETLLERLANLERKRARLMETGIQARESTEFFDVSRLDETNAKIISLYTEDMTRKLSVFDDCVDKIAFLLKIVNARFLQKRMEVTREEGFVFKTPGGDVLRPENLSSGEQHIVVLFYELLFTIEPDSMILIDEPELSLHIYWQQQFLTDLTDIIRFTKFHALIATHSPQIIHDRWDLTVELKGPER